MHRFKSDARGTENPSKKSLLHGLVDIIEQAGTQLIGVGVAVEKGFQPGGARLRSEGVNLHSLAIIERADENGIVFRNKE